MFLLMRQMQQDVCRIFIFRCNVLLEPLAGIALIKTRILDSRQGFALISELTTYYYTKNKICLPSSIQSLISLQNILSVDIF